MNPRKILRYLLGPYEVVRNMSPALGYGRASMNRLNEPAHNELYVQAIADDLGKWTIRWAGCRAPGFDRTFPSRQEAMAVLDAELIRMGYTIDEKLFQQYLLLR